ncbi:toxin-antitoxin system toxin subunit [Streptomyces sp. NPDC047071]|uniref:toxin-antitoxin system toxin subunit n=1 Tax=Streptomyces sp. NPDC047071 TaxID=3154808 RepID=UPI00345175B9
MNPRADTLTTAPGGRHALRMERCVGHPPERVWAALTRPELLKHWFPSEAGAGEPTEVEAPRLYAYTWGDDELRWEIAPDPETGGSLLTLVHTFADRFGAPSFGAGWHLCLSALGELLDGVAEPVRARDTGELHEAYLEQFDLGGGEITADGTVRFERQLVRPADAVWAALTEGDEVLKGSEAPEGLVADGVLAGAVTEVRVPELVAYEVAGGGEVSIRLAPGTEYGARLLLTHRGSGDPTAARAAWHARVERLAGRLLEFSPSGV